MVNKKKKKLCKCKYTIDSLGLAGGLRQEGSLGLEGGLGLGDHLGRLGDRVGVRGLDGVELGDYIGVLGKTIFLGDHLGLGCVKKVCMSLCGVNEQKHT